MNYCYWYNIMNEERRFCHPNLSPSRWKGTLRRHFMGTTATAHSTTVLTTISNVRDRF